MSYISFHDDTIRCLAAAGVHATDIAKEIGVSTAGISAYCKRNGIETVQKPRGPQNPRKGMWPELADRNATIAAMFKDGKTLEEIGQHFNITRERVRQIAGKLGFKPRYVSVKERRTNDLEQMRTLASEGLTYSEIAARLGISVTYAFKLMTNAKISVQFKTPKQRERFPLLQELADKVRAGSSIHSLCGGDYALERRLNWYLKKIGVKSSASCRWSDFTVRKRIITDGLEHDKSWDDMALAVMVAEGRKTTVTNIYRFAVHNGLYVPHSRPRTRRSVRASKPKSAPRKVPRPRAEIIKHSEIRETCVANYGRVPASALAAELGITRNSVIGHWFRARKAGQITGSVSA